MKDEIQAFIVISAWAVYCIMVFTQKANIEGFVVLSTYIVKKFLDIIEVNGKDVKNG